MEYPVHELRYGEKLYSKQLIQINDPPEILYYRGNIDLLNTDCFAIVGTRKMTSYGKTVTEHIVCGLSQSGFTIVSGLAYGIDSVAHKASLDNNLNTIAVFGTGVDDSSIFPSDNFGLAMRILDNKGLLISEYPSGSTGHKGSFPERNRIISGISKGVLVVEADERSGSLITARLAGEQNKDVFTIPGNIFSSRSIGPHKLLRNGAKLVATAEDILEEYGLEYGQSFNSNTDLSTLDPIQKKIIDILETEGEIDIDTLIHKTDLEPSAIMSALAILEIDGVILKNINGLYSKK